MCYIVFVSHSLHWRYIKIALRKYVIKIYLEGGGDFRKEVIFTGLGDGRCSNNHNFKGKGSARGRG